MKNKISVVIGSWGSYNACNERALGSNRTIPIGTRSRESLQKRAFA